MLSKLVPTDITDGSGVNTLSRRSVTGLERTLSKWVGIRFQNTSQGLPGEVYDGDYRNQEQLRGRKHGSTIERESLLGDKHKTCSSCVPWSPRKDNFSIGARLHLWALLNCWQHSFHNKTQMIPRILTWYNITLANLHMLPLAFCVPDLTDPSRVLKQKLELL